MDPLRLTGQVLFPDGALRPGEVVVAEGLIAEVHTLGAAPEQVIAPGFIDLQLNGGYGHDFTASPETVYHVAAHVLPTGVTAYLPTIITAPLESYRRALDALSPLGLFSRSGTQARILGFHFEGPYLSPQRKGAHNPAYLRPRADPLGDGIAGGGLRLMTLAPELANGMQAIRDLCTRGVVVSIGHSAATYEQAVEALDAGATWGTHLFNAMLPLHHRAPGAIGALLADERATVGLIADGVHLHTSMFGWLIRAKGAERITLVTDAIAALGQGPGEYQLGDRRVLVSGTSARLDDGTLAGSILTMDQAVRNLVSWGACSLADALTMASATAAKLLGLEKLGRLAPGCAADIVVLDDTLHVRQTLVNGQVAFNAE
jgi:N-acetylglucosamine-6-phosphate deacetylase